MIAEFFLGGLPLQHALIRRTAASISVRVGRPFFRMMASKAAGVDPGLHRSRFSNWFPLISLFDARRTDLLFRNPIGVGQHCQEMSAVESGVIVITDT